MAVRFRANRRRVIGRDQDAIIAPSCQLFAYRSDDLSVDRFERFDFSRNVALVRCFIRRFDVYTYDIGRIESFDGISTLGCVIGIGVARGTRHFNYVPTDQSGDSSQQIDGRDYLAALPESLGKRFKLRSFPKSPKPDVGCWQLARFHSTLVDRMFGKCLNALAHEVVEQVAAWTSREIV